MREIFRKYAGVIYIALMSVVVVIVLSCTDELEQIYEAFGQMDSRWICAAAGCIGVYILLRMATMRYYLIRRGCRVTWRDVAGATGAGQFYSAITPFASGGQPMQVLWLHRRGVSASIGTACISVKFLGFQTALLLMGALLGLSDWTMVQRQLYGFRWLVVLGFILNGGLLLAVVLTVFRADLLNRLSRWLVGLGAKLHLVKRPEEISQRFQEALSDYCNALRSLVKHPLDGVVIFLLSAMQVLVYMSVVLCLYRAFGLSGTSRLDLLTLQVLLFIAAAFVPLPGAAGAQESGFCVFFHDVFPQGDLMAAMVCWRFFSYYLLIVVGLLLMAVSGIRRSSNPSEISSRKFGGN